MATGRPSSFTQETADAICERLGEGQSLREICRDETMPSKTTVMRWLRSSAEFRDQYASAREVQADHLGDELLEIADDATNDWMTRNAGGDDEARVVNHDHIARSRLRVDARKWLMGKIAPKKYGDKVDMTHSGPDGGPVVFQTLYEKHGPESE